MVVCGIHEHGMDNTGFKHNIEGGRKEAGYWLSTIVIHHPRQIMGRISRQRFWIEVETPAYYTLRLEKFQMDDMQLTFDDRVDAKAVDIAVCGFLRAYE